MEYVYQLPVAIYNDDASNNMQIKAALATALSASPTASDFTVLECERQRIARAYLQQKVKHGALSPNALGCVLDSLACFELGDQLAPYFEAMAWQQHDEAGCYIAFRRLVFSQVNELIFRHYRESDSGLDEVIRALKQTAAADGGLSLRQKGADEWLAVGGASVPLRPLPLVPPELMEAYLRTTDDRLDSWSRIFSVLVSVTALEKSFCNGYPVAGIAYVARHSLHADI